MSDMTANSNWLGDWTNKTYSGGWRDTKTSQDVIEPATGEVIARIGQVEVGDVATAAAAAAKAQFDWEHTAFDSRAAILRKVAQLIEQRFASLAEWIVRETGASRLKAEFELGASIRAVYEAAAMPSQPGGLVLPSDRSLLSYAKRRALGVAGIISPFNFPFFLSIRAVAPALAVGNAVLLKPSPFTAVSGGFLIAELFNDAGLPPGLLHIFTGGADIGHAMCSDPNVNMIHFVGSTDTGRRVGEAASRNLKKVSLEMGGKNALIITEDADLDLAAANAAWASFMHQGQICFAAGRIIVQKSVVEEFSRKLTALTKAIRVGNPATENVALGPLVSAAQAGKVERIVNDSLAAGAKIITGGKRNGLFYDPTVLVDVKPGMPAYDEEIFGPVACITPFDTDDEAVSIANSTDYGLAAAIICPSIGRALRIGERLRVGSLHINDQTIAEEAVNPICGWGASGNSSSIGGPANWDEFSQWQWVTIKETPPMYPIGLPQ